MTCTLRHLDLVTTGAQPPSSAVAMQRILRVLAVAAGWRAGEGLLLLQRGLLPHICVGLLLLFPDIWLCPWQLGGSREVHSQARKQQRLKRCGPFLSVT